MDPWLLSVSGAYTPEKKAVQTNSWNKLLHAPPMAVVQVFGQSKLFAQDALHQISHTSFNTLVVCAFPKKNLLKHYLSSNTRLQVAYTLSCAPSLCQYFPIFWLCACCLLVDWRFCHFFDDFFMKKLAWEAASIVIRETNQVFNEFDEFWWLFKNFNDFLSDFQEFCWFSRFSMIFCQEMLKIVKICQKLSKLSKSR